MTIMLINEMHTYSICMNMCVCVCVYMLKKAHVYENNSDIINIFGHF